VLSQKNFFLTLLQNFIAHFTSLLTDTGAECRVYKPALCLRASRQLHPLDGMFVPFCWHICFWHISFVGILSAYLFLPAYKPTTAPSGLCVFLLVLADLFDFFLFVPVDFIVVDE